MPVEARCPTCGSIDKSIRNPLRVMGIGKFDWRECQNPWHSPAVPEAAPPKMVRHEMSGDEINGWTCWQCNLFTRDVAVAADHDGETYGEGAEPSRREKI